MFVVVKFVAGDVLVVVAVAVAAEHSTLVAVRKHVVVAEIVTEIAAVVAVVVVVGMAVADNAAGCQEALTRRN